MKLLRKLKGVFKVAQLICFDVVYSQEGVLLMVVMEKGEISLSKYLENRKILTVSNFLYVWEATLECITALHLRWFLLFLILHKSYQIFARNIIHMDIKPPNFVFVRGQMKVKRNLFFSVFSFLAMR